MTKLAWVLVAAAAGLAGCAPSYRVHINTYSELGAPLDQATTIYVAVDPNAQNPILRKQVVSKIRDLLTGDGYRPVDTPRAALYTLTFEMGTNSERVLDYMPIGGPFGSYGYGGPRGRGFGMGFGYSTYVPYIDTVYTHWLRMKLYSTKDAPQKPEGGEATTPAERRTVWLGEALLGTESPEFRTAINYLLAGCIQYLGIDTEKWVTLTIQEDDPRIEGISTE